MPFVGVEGSGSGRGVKEGAGVREGKKEGEVEDRRLQGLKAARECSYARISIHSPLDG